MEETNTKLITVKMTKEEIERLKLAHCKEGEPNRTRWIKKVLAEKCNQVLGTK
jgi:hypothetical protein